MGKRIEINNLKSIELSGEEQIYSAIHGLRSDLFNQSLNDTTVIRSLSQKYASYGIVLEAIYDDEICGISAFYCNDQESRKAFLSLIVIDKALQNKGIGSFIIEETKKYCKHKGMESLLLEVDNNNFKAINFYKKHKFLIEKKGDTSSIYKSNL